MRKLEEILEEREKTHGEFATFSKAYCEFLVVLNSHMDPDTFPVEAYAALCSIFGKVSRIVAGNPRFADHWDDIAGYATLASKEFAVEQAKADLTEDSLEQALKEVRELTGDPEASLSIKPSQVIWFNKEETDGKFSFKPPSTTEPWLRLREDSVNVNPLSRS